MTWEYVAAVAIVGVPFAIYVFGVDIRIASWLRIRETERDMARLLVEAVRDRDANLKLIGFHWEDGGRLIATVEFYGKIEQWVTREGRWCRREDELSRSSDWFNEWLDAQWAGKQ